jgi:hypothetical protein
MLRTDKGKTFVIIKGVTRKTWFPWHVRCPMLQQSASHAYEVPTLKSIKISSIDFKHGARNKVDNSRALFRLKSSVVNTSQAKERHSLVIVSVWNTDARTLTWLVKIRPGYFLLYGRGNHPQDSHNRCTFLFNWSSVNLDIISVEVVSQSCVYGCITGWFKFGYVKVDVGLDKRFRSGSKESNQSCGQRSSSEVV